MMNENINPSWTDGLQQCGQYYEGIVGNAAAVLELHKQDTVTTFGIRRSKKPASSSSSMRGKKVKIILRKIFQR